MFKDDGTDEDKPIVYMTSDMSVSSLVKIYEALGALSLDNIAMKLSNTKAIAEYVSESTDVESWILGLGLQ